MTTNQITQVRADQVKRGDRVSINGAFLLVSEAKPSNTEQGWVQITSLFGVRHYMPGSTLLDV